MTHKEITGVTFSNLDPSGFQGHRSFPASIAHKSR